MVEALDFASNLQMVSQEELSARAKAPVKVMKPRENAGICFDCEDPIDQERLALNANALRCFGCQGEFENGRV